MKKSIATLAAAMFCCGLLAGPAAAATYSLTYSDGPLAITETDENGDLGNWVYADILVDAPGNITDVNIFVDITHTYIGDLDIYIAHQEEGASSWKWVQLYNNNNEYRNNMSNVLFDDQATTYINNAAPPYGPGSFKPTSNGPDADGDSNLLSFFNGDLAAGIWSLALYDNVQYETGTLNSFRVDLETDAVPQTAVPLPGAVVLLGSGLGALAGVRRRSRQK
ncbi:MAG: VPLPA-CTERM sorting domain-containing protein [Desulfobulbaceae bacterium]|nr:VPLPA-CTERM sorting domain-containing protein [Desulfobulbaceae bacterium]